MPAGRGRGNARCGLETRSGADEANKAHYKTRQEQPQAGTPVVMYAESGYENEGLFYRIVSSVCIPSKRVVESHVSRTRDSRSHD